jgi:hypothetical protein
VPVGGDGERGNIVSAICKLSVQNVSLVTSGLVPVLSAGLKSVRTRKDMGRARVDDAGRAAPGAPT